MLTCREMSELGSAIIERRLGLRTRWAVMMHLRMCPRCKLYVEQLELTSKVLQQMPIEAPSVDVQAILKRLQGLER